jgi:hypothetical protein
MLEELPSRCQRPNMRLKLTAPFSRGGIVFVTTESERRSFRRSGLEGLLSF